MIIDTGFSGLVLPPSVAEKVYSGVSGAKQMKDWEGDDTWAHNCGDKIPDLQISIGDYTTEIKGEQFEGAPIKKSGMCELQVQPPPEDSPHAEDAILGALFHQVTYVIYELTNADNP